MYSACNVIEELIKHRLHKVFIVRIGVCAVKSTESQFTGVYNIHPNMHMHRVGLKHSAVPHRKQKLLI